MSRGRGARRSAQHKLDARHPAAGHPRIAQMVSSPPPSASLEQHEPAREDQGPTGSCTAHSGSAGSFTAIASKAAISGASGPLPFVPSPRELYAATRAIERAAASPDVLPALTDSGAELADVVTALGRYGVAPMQGPTSDGRNSDVETANVNAEPDVDQLEAGQTYLVCGAYGITIDASVSQTCAAAVAAGYPIYVAFFCDTAFENWQKGDAPYGAPVYPNDPNGGGHAVFIDGYTTDASGARTWRLVNSWGTSWGDSGTILVSDAFLAACYELWVLDLTVSTTKAVS